MRRPSLTYSDQALIEAARDVIVANYEYGRHHLGAAVLMTDGRVFTGVHLEANVGRVAVCAEAIAIGNAISAGSRGIDLIVAVSHPHLDDTPKEPWVVAPCGICRELISDYGINADVIIPGEDGLIKVPVISLLPAKYTQRG